MASPSNWSLDIINIIVLESNVLSVSDWGACLLVCKRWCRALRVPTLKKLIDIGASTSYQEVSGDTSLGLTSGVAKLGQLRKWKMTARRWISNIIETSGDSEEDLVMKYMGSLSPFDVWNAVSGLTILDTCAISNEAPRIYRKMLALAGVNSNRGLYYNLLIRSCAANAPTQVRILLEHCGPEKIMQRRSWTSSDLLGIPKLAAFGVPEALRSHPLMWALSHKQDDITEQIIHVILEVTNTQYMDLPPLKAIALVAREDHYSKVCKELGHLLK